MNKYRVWDKNNNKYIDILGMESFLRTDAFGQLRIVMQFVDKNKTESPFWLADGNTCYIIENFIGQKDTNGKEIFEGDIVSYDDIPTPTVDKESNNAIVKYNADLAAYIRYSPEKDAFKFMNTKYIKILGNIHENPDLVKYKTE